MIDHDLGTGGGAVCDEHKEHGRSFEYFHRGNDPPKKTLLKWSHIDITCVLIFVGFMLHEVSFSCFWSMGIKYGIIPNNNN